MKIVMEDSVSVKSNDSVATSDEYEFVNGGSAGKGLLTIEQPLLKIANNGNLDDLCKSLTEVLSEDTNGVSKMENNATIKHVPVNQTIKKVGQSMFYEVDTVKSALAVSAVSKETEKIDAMKSEDEVPDVQQDCTIFSGVSYLGAAAINAPKSEAEIQRNMGILNEQSSEQAIKVSVSVPSSSDGTVVLYDAASHVVMARYEIHRILFYARGTAGSSEASCFAFTWSHGDTQESAIFQCHVFRCDIPEAVGQVSACFAKAFQRVPKSMISSVTSSDLGPAAPPDKEHVEVYIFEVSMEIKEEDGRGGFSAVPKDRSYFKLRVNLEKQLCLTVQQVSENERDLEVERCFGVLVSPGRNVKHSDMQLLEMVSMGSGTGDKQCYVISGHWDPADPAFEALNVETRDGRTYITVAVDLVIRGIQEPVRFLIETPVKVFPQGERFWYFSRRPLIQQFYLNLREVPSNDVSTVHYEVMSIDTSGELDRNRLNLTLNLASLIRSPSITSIDIDTLTPKEEAVSDGDEPLLSGTGEVSKDCSEMELESWAEVLARWTTTKQRPRQLAPLVRGGIPEALRGEVWQRLAGCENDTAMMDTYRILITKDSSCENVIQRDINRTFPAHDFFKEAGGLGQDSLYRISKAYAVHDSEVGYCQGLSFLAATLLLHMPEEQAFCILVKLMYDYGLRDLYKDGFENLYMRLYQLNRLMEEQLPQLWQHFSDKGVESHMFASQWFLTLFTARFPLYFVFHIIDVFLLQGVDTLFQVALALLMMCKKELLQLDFESILKYFRVTLPKKCRTEEVARQLMKLATSLKVKKLKKYEQEFTALKEAQDNADQYTNELDRLKSTLLRTEEEKKRLEDEVTQVKEMLKREVQKAENESNRNTAIITEYKQICQRLDDEQVAAKGALNELRSQVAGCAKCRALLGDGNVAENGGDPVIQTNKNSDPQLTRAQERIRELELELAQTKLAHVEAECRNQDLVHQLHSAVAELQTARNSWPPWLHKTLSSIKEVANKKELPGGGTLAAVARRDVVAAGGPAVVARRDSAPGLSRDSISRESLRDM
ncbi:rab GTPase-activating protein 1-like isoform X2 [Periplaneta americana]|uniref:rab GTPase-activating protein 1-like isoform X2 n=1 Tax=Periplaneta americana TaxID=6978 RepID=UPI0037E77BA0